MKILIIFLSIFFLYIAAAFYLYTNQEKYIFPRKYAKDEYKVPAELAKKITTKDGTVLEGFHKKSGKQKLILYFDGNSDNVNQMIEFLDRFPDMDIAGINHRGFGKSEGEPSEKALFSDSIEIYDHFKPDYDEIFLIGRSLGTGVVSFLSKQRVVSGAVLVTPYHSIKELAGVRFPFFPLDFLVKHKFESYKYIADNPTKFAVLEVASDHVVPNSHSARLADLISNLVLREMVDNTSHGAVVFDDRFYDFLQNAFLRFGSKI